MTRSEPKRPIVLVGLTSRVTPDDLAAVPSDGDLVACDFYVEGIEEVGEEVVGGYRLGRILNVDHHAPAPRMWRQVSSTNLALELMEAGADAIAKDAVVVVNHVDCDSVLSSAILAGHLPADPEFGEAAIAADHTGDENLIADLLQGIDAYTTKKNNSTKRGLADYRFALESVTQLRSGGPAALDAEAREALEARLRKRGEAEALVSRGAFHEAGALRFAVVDEPIEGELFYRLIPDAAVIMLANRLSADPPRWQVKLRLGQAAPPGFALSDLGIEEFDPCYGGRWNAGSNRRLDPETGLRGTPLDPEEYAARLLERLERRLTNSSRGPDR